jgi:putative oxidoreductase
MEMLTSTLTKIGPYLIAIPAAIFGILHFMGADGMAGMVPIPGGAIWVYITGLALIAAAVSVIIGKKTRMAATLLAVLLLIFVLTIHLPGVIAGGDGGQMSLMSMLKDLMIAGGALVYAKTQPVE